MVSTLTFSFPWSKSGRTVENTLSGRLKVTEKDNQGYVYVACFTFGLAFGPTRCVRTRRLRIDRLTALFIDSLEIKLRRPLWAIKIGRLLKFVD